MGLQLLRSQHCARAVAGRSMAMQLLLLKQRRSRQRQQDAAGSRYVDSQLPHDVADIQID